jgi:uncharacterized protein YuzE
VNLEYDRSADAAYLSLTPIKAGGVKKTYACDPDEVGGLIQLDFDEDGRLVGVEVLNASHLLPQGLLRAGASPK